MSPSLATFFHKTVAHKGLSFARGIIAGTLFLDQKQEESWVFRSILVLSLTCHQLYF